MSVAFLMLTVPDSEPDRLETPRLQPGIVDGVWTPEITSHDDTPDNPAPQNAISFPSCAERTWSPTA